MWADLEHKGEVAGGNAAGVEQLLVTRQCGRVRPRVCVAHSILVTVAALGVYHLRLAHEALPETARFSVTSFAELTDKRISHDSIQ